jgi:hypothetical protein
MMPDFFIVRYGSLQLIMAEKLKDILISRPGVLPQFIKEHLSISLANVRQGRIFEKPELLNEPLPFVLLIIW